MSRRYKIAILVFLLLIGFLTYLEAIEPEPVNWNSSYSSRDKIPMGTYVLHESLEQEFKEMQQVALPPYEFRSENDPQGTYIFINSNLAFDDEELDKLLHWVEQGNNLFLATDAFSKNLLDTLQLNVATKIPAEGLESKPMVNLVNPELKSSQAYLFDKDVYHSVFIEIDTSAHTVLGVSQLYEDTLLIEEPEVNFIAVEHGEGRILLSTTPQAFTNFFLLHENNFRYVERALGYLPGESVLYWDEYKKDGKVFQTSPLYILLGSKPLKWAYYFTLAGALCFVLFEGKRKQRAIPVVKPLENQTYNFTRTIAGLYLDRKDYKKIASKKIALFLEYVRLHFRLPTSTIDEEFYKNLSAQSGSSVEEVRQFFQMADRLETKPNITKEELLALNSAIDSIKSK